MRLLRIFARRLNLVPRADVARLHAALHQQVAAGYFVHGGNYAAYAIWSVLDDERRPEAEAARAVATWQGRPRNRMDQTSADLERVRHDLKGILPSDAGSRPGAQPLFVTASQRRHPDGERSMPVQLVIPVAHADDVLADLRYTISLGYLQEGIGLAREALRQRLDRGQDLRALALASRASRDRPLTGARPRRCASQIAHDGA
jgi:hypothetical protein